LACKEGGAITECNPCSTVVKSARANGSFGNSKGSVLMPTLHLRSSQFPIHRLTSLSIGIATVSILFLFSLPAAADDDVDDADDDDLVEVVRGRRQQIEVLRLKVLIESTADLSSQFDAMMRARLAFVDRVCGLNDVQSAKLRLAVRGDKKRLIGRIEEIAAQLELTEDDPEKLQELVQRSRLIQGSIVRPGSSVAGTYFVKTLERQLTAEQALRYAPLRAVYREGGLIQVHQRGGDEVVEINLAGTAFADDHLVGLSGWPASPMLVKLDLAGTKVSDAGFRDLNGLVHLRELDLSNTRITDTGLENLKGLTSLKHLYLRGLNEILSDEGAYELKRALPKVELHW
jgi:hypothetical protein